MPEDTAAWKALGANHPDIPRDVRAALRRECTVCGATPGHWCLIDLRTHRDVRRMVPKSLAEAVGRTHMARVKPGWPGGRD